MRLVYSDASGTGYGGIELNMNVRLHMGGSPDKRWQVPPHGESCVQSRGSWNHWFLSSETKGCDSFQIIKMGYESLWRVGSRQTNLQTLALNIFILCMANQIRLEPE